MDKTAENGVFVTPSNLPSKKIIFSGTGKFQNDWDDVRSFALAAKSGVEKALATGSVAPLLFFNATKFPQSEIVTLLGALEAQYIHRICNS